MAAATKSSNGDIPKENEVGEDNAGLNKGLVVAPEETPKTEKKTHEKRKRNGVNDTDAPPAGSDGERRDQPAKEDEPSKEKKTREERRAERERRRAAKSSLLESVPKADKNGIAYTKLQVRRMLRRVQRGLDPVPTEEEERERLIRIKAEEKEMEDDLAGMIYDREKERGGHSDDDDDGDCGGGNGEEEREGSGGDSDSDEDDDDKEGKAVERAAAEDCPRPRQKKKTNKPVPSDYVCQACQNKNIPAHWIYDCPDKVRRPGTNLVKKKLRGVRDPDARKVFVSGLPYEVKVRDVVAYFAGKAGCGKVKNCKLLTFEDSGRCRGQAFITFESEEGARKAMEASGNVLIIETKKDAKGKKRGANAGVEKKELRLKVTKVMNRTLTKKKGKQ